MPDRALIPLWIGGFVAGLLFTFLARAFARWRGILNHPNPIIPQHKKAVAYLGGLGLLGGLVATFAAAALLRGDGAISLPPLPGSGWQLALPAVLFVAMGTADDLLTFAAKWKLLCQLAIATVAVALGATLPLTGNTAVDTALAVFWIVGMVNAFNLTDVCDGLLAGIASVMLVAIAFLVPEVAGTALVCCTVTLGFVVFNAPPASIYLGDGGSHLLGFICAALLMRGAQGQAPWPYAASALLVCAVPLFELIFLTVVRMRKRLPWWRGSPDHFSLRLQQAGFSRLRTDLLTWGAAAAIAGVGVALPRMAGTWRWLTLAVIALALAAVWRWLLIHEVRRDG